ncbi:MAG: spore coat protein [Oscillospiraceae bacterium]|nr:spore coat protein [Oscillospiraceae bacterium]
MAMMSDKEVMGDILATHKHITAAYNSYSNECMHKPLREDLLNILREEHNIQSGVFTEMEKRGWYVPPCAEQQMIDQTKTKFQSVSATL